MKIGQSQHRRFQPITSAVRLSRHWLSSTISKSVNALLTSWVISGAGGGGGRLSVAPGTGQRIKYEKKRRRKNKMEEG